MQLLNLVNESRFTSAKGSEEGRQKMMVASKKSHTKAGKSRVKVYNSIMDALEHGYVGQMFSTKDADRLYVITKRKWGKDPEQTAGGRSAKAFYSFKDAKKFAVRTLYRHGKDRAKKYGSEKYWSKERKD